MLLHMMQLDVQSVTIQDMQEELLVLKFLT